MIDIIVNEMELSFNKLEKEIYAAKKNRGLHVNRNVE